MCIEAKIQHVLISLNHGQGSVFKLRECAQSTPHMKLPPEYDFEGEISKFFDFRFNTHIYFPESGLRKHFCAYVMRAIDFRMILPLYRLF